MKKFFIITTIMLMLTSSAFAQDFNYEEKSMCPAIPNINGPISSTLSKITGMNFLLSTTLESQIRRQMNEAFATRFKVDIVPFGGKSMLEGKFKSISADADSAIIDNIYYLSDIHAESLCGYNHFVHDKGEILTAENFLFGVRANITNSDLQKMVTSPDYVNLVNSLNISVGNITLFKVYSPKAEIKKGKFVLTIEYLSPLVMKNIQKVEIKMDLAVINGNLEFTNVEATSNHSSSADLQQVLPIFNKLNPLTLKTHILGNARIEIKLKEVYIVNDKILLKGLVIVPKNNSIKRSGYRIKKIL